MPGGTGTARLAPMAIEVHEPAGTEHSEWAARLDAYVRCAREATDALEGRTRGKTECPLDMTHMF